MQIACFAYLLGVLVALTRPSVPVSVWLALTLLLILAFAFKRALIVPVFFVLALVWSFIYISIICDPVLPEQASGNWHRIRGTIVAPIQIKSHSIRFLLRTEAPGRASSGVAIRGRIRLNWYQKRILPKPGQRWEFIAKLKHPHGMRNPGGFDYQRWLQRRNIVATGYIKSASARRLADSSVRLFQLTNLREWIRVRLDQVGATQRLPASHIGVFQALLLGRRDDMPLALKQLLRDTGTAHLLAISGMHIGLIAWFLFLLSSRLWSACHACTNRIAAVKLASLVALLGALGYALLSGWQIPSQRALLMIALLSAGALLLRRYSLANSIALSLLLILVFDPMAVMDPGFWLSYIAVSGIVIISCYRIGATPAWRVFWKIQWGLFWLLTPLSLYIFNQSSWLMPFANLLAIPALTFVLMPLLFVALLLLTVSPELAGLLLSLASLVLEWLLFYLRWLAGLAGSSTVLAAPSLLAITLFAAASLFVLLPFPRMLRTIGILVAVGALGMSSGRLPHGDLRVTVLDVGQGLAVVLRTRNHVMVYDTGPAFRSGFNTGAAVVIPYLRSRGITRLDLLMLSHADNDHAGGTATLLTKLDVIRLMSGEVGRLQRQLAQTRQRSRLIHACRRGQRWQWDSVHFRLLAPDDDSLTGSNNRSCVLQIRSGRFKLLLPGDIEKDRESQLVATSGDKLHSQVLLAPHHGSNTSSHREFIEKVRPRFVLFSVGYKNRFGFPKSQVVRRYKQRRVYTLSTAQHGAIILYWSASTRTLTVQVSRSATGFQGSWKF